MNRIYNIQLDLSPYPNVYAGGGFGNFFKSIGNWVRHPFDKTARYNASVQSNPDSYGSGEITNFNTTGNGTTDWGSMGGFATGQTSQNNITNPYQGTTMMEQSFTQTGTPTGETIDGNAFADISKSGKSEGTWTRGGGGVPWGSIISAAGTNIANAFLDTEASTADRVAGALGIPALANQWRADTSKGDSYLKGMTSTLDSMSDRNYLQDASSTFGANNAVKLNNKQTISPISAASGLPSLKDFKGNWWRNMGASVAQGAASGSVGGPWGALGGAVTGLFVSIGGLFGRKKRAEKAYDDFLRKRDTLMSAQQNAFNTAVKNQTLSNMQALANGNMSQRINDMANIRAFGGDIDPTNPFVKESQPKDTVYPTYPLTDFYERSYGYKENSEKNFFPDRNPKDWYKYAAGNWAESMENPADSARMVNLFENRQYLTPEQQRSLWDRLTTRTPQYDEDGYDALQDKDGNWLVSDYFNFNNTKAYGGNLYPDGGTIGEGYEEVAQEPVYEGGELPEIIVSTESMPWYEKWYNKSKRALGRGWENVKKVMATPTMTALPGQSPIFQGQFFPTMPSTVGDDLEYALSIVSAPWDMEGIGQAAWVLKHPKEAAKLLKQPMDKIVEWAKKKTSKEHKLITDSDWDNAYNSAIKANDMVEAQRLRDAHFLERASNDAISKNGHPEIMYHSVDPMYDPKFNSFDTNIEGRKTFVYTTNNKNMSRSYTKGQEFNKDMYRPAAEYAADAAIAENRNGLLTREQLIDKYIKEFSKGLEHKANTTKELYGKLNNPWIIEGNYHNWDNIPTRFSEYNEIVPVERSTREVEDLIQINNEIGNKKYDGAIMNNISDWGSAYLQPERDIFTLNTLEPTVKPNPDFYGTVYSFENPKNLKYRDAITYDDAGNIIPLSKRDNFNINDLRYGLIPFLGLTGYGLTNNVEYAMGGNLYTDLSPNMMNLWNNKQQIDQQKTMNQQFSLGLGNSSFVNKFETGGPVDPPKEFMDVYHPDWGIYTPAYANMTFEEYKQKYGNPNDPDNFDYSPESYNSYQYRLYQPYPNSSTFGNSYLFRPEMNVLNKKYPIENLPVYRDKKGDLYLKRGIKDLYGNNDVYIEGNTEDPTYNRRNENGDLRITPHKDEWELGHTDKSVPRESFEAFKKSSEEQLLNELRRRAYDNEFYSYPEVQKYKVNNSKQKSSNTTTKKTSDATATKSSSERKVSSKTATKSTNNIDNMTYQQMEDYYGQKQSPLFNAQYKNTWAEGGQMTSADVPENMQYYANGGTHEENPYGGIQVGVDQQGTPNLTEEGEFRWNNFVFSDRINVDANLLSSFNLVPSTKHQNKKAAKGKLSYADMAKKYAKRNKELENDPITKNSMEAFMQRLANAQEYQKKEAQLEAQKQNELQDYKTALNKQNNNPMYGTMKYNGMGNAATQQGVNSGVDAGMGNPMSNADLSNVNRSGNEMMAAYGGNLFAIGGKDDPNPYEWTLDNLNARQVLTPWNSNFIGPTLENSTNLGITPNADNYSWGNIDVNTPFYQNEGWGIDMKPTYMKVKNPNYNAPAVSTYATRDKNGKIIYDPSGKPFMSYPRTYEGMKSSDYPNTKVIGKTVDNNGFYLNVPQYTPPAQGKVIQPEYEPDLSDYKAAYYKDFYSNGINTTPYVQDNIVRGNNGISNIPITASGINPTGVPSDNSNNIGDTNTVVTNSNNIKTDSRIDKTTTNTNPDAAIPSDPKEAPLYSTAGKYAQFGKGIMPMIWDWANKTNVKYDPYQRDADRLEALANEGPVLRTADTIGGYRAPNLMDVERLNNSARAEGLAQMQAILDAANGNRGFVGAQSAQNNYNTQMGIGNNYVKTQEANNANRLQTDQFNHGINVANQNAINTMYQDNQRAEQTQHQAALSGTAQAAALRQRENLHADEVNTERMKNRATNQAAYVDNALNYFTTQAMENQELNTRNNDPTNPYWIDKNGVTHYTGDSGLNQAIHDEFGNDEYGRNGTFTGERLTEWNNLTKKYKAKDLKEHPELWRHLVTQQKEANKIDAEKAKQARMEELEALRGTYQSNLARLNALRDSGAIISDPSYNLYTGWADEDYSGNQGLLRTRNQALDQYITQIGNNYDRYLYDKQLAQNQAKALGGYLNDGQNNNNYYYSYTRI